MDPRAPFRRQPDPILLAGDQGCLPAGGDAGECFQRPGPKQMMIRKWREINDVETLRLQGIEKPLRPGKAGKAAYPRTWRKDFWPPNGPDFAKCPQDRSAKPGEFSRWRSVHIVGPCMHQYDGMGARKSFRKRFAQGAARKQPARAEQAAGIHREQAQILVQMRVLKAVIERQHPATRSDRRLRCGHAIRPDEMHAVPGEQQSLVAYQARIMMPGIDPQDALHPPAIAARQRREGDVPGAQGFSNGAQDRGLAGPAQCRPAHAQNGCRNPFRRHARHAGPPARMPDPAHRGQQRPDGRGGGAPMNMIPEFRCAHAYFRSSKASKAAMVTSSPAAACARIFWAASARVRAKAGSPARRTRAIAIASSVSARIIASASRNWV